MRLHGDSGCLTNGPRVCERRRPFHVRAAVPRFAVVGQERFMARNRTWALLMVAALVLLGADAAAPRTNLRFADRPEGKTAQTNVDVELVLAVDISYSMDPDEQVLQREGYREALTSPEFLNALAPGHARQDRRHLFRMGRRGRPADRRAVAGHRRARRARRRSPTRSAGSRSAAPTAPRFRARCCSRRRCSRKAAIAASAASSTCPATAPTTRASW